MQPENLADWIAFLFLVIGALAWGGFLAEVNVLTWLLERHWEWGDDVVFGLIALAGLYGIVRVAAGSGSRTRARFK